MQYHTYYFLGYSHLRPTIPLPFRLLFVYLNHRRGARFKRVSHAFRVNK